MSAETAQTSQPAEPAAAEPAAAGPSATGPAQSELDLGVVPTGHDRVDAALEQLECLTELPVAEHAPLYEDVHARLHGVLTGGPETGDGPATG